MTNKDQLVLRRSRVRLAASAVIFSLVATHAARSDDPGNDLFRAALKFYASEDYKSACDLFEKGLSVSTGNAANGKASYYFGKCLLALNKQKQALIAFRRSAELSAESEQGRSAKIELAKLETSLAERHDPTLSSDRRAVSAFNWIYRFQPSPGLRSWSLTSSNRWLERYPDGHVAKIFDRLARGSASDCAGVIVSSSGEPDFEVFIPDMGCPRMVALFRRERGSWNVMAEMMDVR